MSSDAIASDNCHSAALRNSCCTGLAKPNGSIPGCKPRICVGIGRKYGPSARPQTPSANLCADDTIVAARQPLSTRRSAPGLGRQADELARHAPTGPVLTPEATTEGAVDVMTYCWPRAPRPVHPTSAAGTPSDPGRAPWRNLAIESSKAV